MSFRKFEPTPENVEKLQKILKEIGGYAETSSFRPINEVVEQLLMHPLTRVGYVWNRIFGHSALSPFAFAGITQNAPRACIKQLQEEGTFTDIDLCGTVELPVCFLSYGLRNDMWPRTKHELRVGKYDEEVLQNEHNEIEDEEGWGDSVERAHGSARWENRTLEKMLKRWGGKTWKKHCRRVFDPFHAVDGNEITLDQWRALKKAYFVTSSGRPE